MTILALLLSAVALATAETQMKSYDGYKLVSIEVRDKADAETVKQLEEQGGDLWVSHILPGASVSMLLSPELQHYAFQTLDSQAIPYNILNHNIEDALREERDSNDFARLEGRIVGTFARYADIEKWLKTQANACGNNCVLETIGKSYEGRTMYAFRFGKNIKTGAVLPRIFSESSFHAREWLAQASHIYIIDQLVSKFGKDASITAAFSQYEIDFVVAANPDGYEYSQSKDRLWRKTRSSKSGTTCKGADPNRNFDYYWCGEGTSTNPCADTYCGSKAFSEVESKAIANFITAAKSSIKGYIGQHTYCQMILIPFGYTTGAYPSDYSEILRVGKAMASSMKTAGGKTYTVGNSADMLYPAAGASDDWAKGVAKIKYTFTIELRPACSASNGFVVKTSEIAPAGKELLAAIVTMVNEMK